MYSILNFPINLVPPAGIEPTAKEPESFILSIKLRRHSTVAKVHIFPLLRLTNLYYLCKKKNQFNYDKPIFTPKQQYHEKATSFT